MIMVFLSGCAHKAPAEPPAGTYLDNIFATENKNPDADMFRRAMPAYLEELDGLIRKTQDQKTIFRAAGAYYAYAFSFVEDTDAERAKVLYLKGRDYALSELRRYGAFDQAFGKPIEDFRKAIDYCFDKRNIEPLFWTSVNWLGWIDLNLDKPEARADIPKVEALLEYVNMLDGSYNNGAAHAALGTLYANLPKADGGDPQKAKEQFSKAFIVSGNSLMIFHVMYAEFYATQIKDRELFKKTLEKVLATPADQFPDKTFVNEVARRKARVLLDSIGKYFKAPEVKKSEEPGTNTPQ
jgi:tetratricopeptide (TPR) repeat protein